MHYQEEANEPENSYVHERHCGIRLHGSTKQKSYQFRVGKWQGNDCVIF